MRVLYGPVLGSFLAAATTASANAAPINLTYDVFACDGACAIGPLASGANTPGPTLADFQAFYGKLFPSVDPSTLGFTWNQIGSNAAGDRIGNVFGSFQVSASYVWNGTALTCCYSDEPYAITGLNDNGLFIGSLGFGIARAFVATAGGPVPPQVSVQLSDEALSFLSTVPTIPGLPPGTPAIIDYVAIDDNNRISAKANGLNVVFVPVPEPMSLSLLAAGIAGFVTSRRRKQKG